jgi:hypothetical protein
MAHAGRLELEACSSGPRGAPSEPMRSREPRRVDPVLRRVIGPAHAWPPGGLRQAGSPRSRGQPRAFRGSGAWRGSFGGTVARLPRGAVRRAPAIPHCRDRDWDRSSAWAPASTEWFAVQRPGRRQAGATTLPRCLCGDQIRCSAFMATTRATVNLLPASVRQGLSCTQTRAPTRPPCGASAWRRFWETGVEPGLCAGS